MQTTRRSCTYRASGTSMTLDEEGATLCLWNKLAKCLVPTLAGHFVLCKYSSTSQSRVKKNCRSPGATYIWIFHLTEWFNLSFVYYELAVVLLQLLLMRSLWSGTVCRFPSFLTCFSLPFFTDSKITQAAVLGSALPGGWWEELRGVHVTCGQFCQVRIELIM